MDINHLCDLAERSAEDRMAMRQRHFRDQVELVTPWLEDILEEALTESALAHRFIDLRFIRNDCPSSRHDNRRLPADLPQDLTVVQVALRNLFETIVEKMKARGHSLSLDITTWPDYTYLEVVPSWAM